MSPIPFLMNVLTARDNNGDQENQYGYVPTQSICVLFIVLYALSCALHTGQALYYRLWFIFPTIILGGLVEIIGWSGRYWSTRNLLLGTPFLMQISSTIIAPTFILAANFIIFGRVITELGSIYSRLRPKTYAILFFGCDIISLAVQGLGGGLASSSDTLQGANNGAHIMLGGIVFQLVLIVVYAFLFTEFLHRYHYDKPFTGRLDGDNTSNSSVYRGEFYPKLKVLTVALLFNALCLFIRAIYRTVELSDGWNGRVIHTQVYFNVLDGGMVVLAMFTLNFVHPGHFLRAPTAFIGKK